MYVGRLERHIPGFSLLDKNAREEVIGDAV